MTAMSNLKSYDKYHVKKNPSTGYTLEKDGEPVLGDLAKSDCRLEPRHVKTLNHGWQNSGIYYKEVEPVIIEAANDTSRSREDIEKEARSLGIQFRSTIGDDKLLEKINETKDK